MNKLQKLFLSVLSVLTLFCCVSCSFSEFFTGNIPEDNAENDGQTDEQPAEKSFFTVARYTGEELDPYRSAGRTNRDLLSLCYNGLIRIGDGLTAIPDLCERYEINGKRATFHIGSDARFADGTNVRASDCAYSFQKADTAGSVYKNRFDRIIGYEATGELEFTVWFSTENPANINLIDIPIIKAGSDNGLNYPTGAGEYFIVRDFETMTLMRKDSETNIEIIRVADVNSAEQLLYGINYGKISASYIDLSEGNSSYRNGTELIDFTTNDFVFAVVNRSKEYFADINAVKGITYAIRRNAITENILSPSSKAVWYPFNPDWQRTVEAELNGDIYSTATAHDYFTQAGITLSGTERVFDRKPVELVIVVNQENLTKVRVAESIADDLREMGFSAIVRDLKWDEMKKTVLAGEYDIFIGEMNLFPNMELNSLLSDELIYSASLPEETQGKEKKEPGGFSADFFVSMNDFFAGETDMRTFLNAFQNELPVIPLYFCGGALAVNRQVSGTFSPNVYSLYEGIETWRVD